jgi:hypothetical protein
VGLRLCLAVAWAAWTIKATLNRMTKARDFFRAFFVPQLAARLWSCAEIATAYGGGGIRAVRRSACCTTVQPISKSSSGLGNPGKRFARRNGNYTAQDAAVLTFVTAKKV